MNKQVDTIICLNRLGTSTTASQLASRLGIHYKSAVSRLNILIRGGFVKKSVAPEKLKERNGKRGRFSANIYKLTAKGRKIASRANMI